jgi:hypothetical protein
MVRAMIQRTEQLELIRISSEIASWNVEIHAEGMIIVVAL